MKKILTLLMILSLGISSAVAKTPIKGTIVASADRMYEFVKATNSSFDREIADAFHSLGAKYGIRGDIALCQSIIETGWFKYTGGTAVTPDDHNYCGLGVTTLGKKGCQFDTVEEGVEAQLQHLWAYCCKDDLPSWATKVDPRFTYVTRGCAPNWEDLSKKWSTASNYGSQIINMYNDMMEFSMPNKELKASTLSVSLSGVQGGEMPSQSITITGVDLTSPIKYNGSSSAFLVSTTNWNDYTGGTMTITLDTSKDAGDYSGYVAVQSGSGESIIRLQIQCAGTITGNGSGDDGGDDGDDGGQTPPDDTTKPTITATPSSFTITGQYGSTDAPYVDVKIVATNLSADMSCNSSSGVVSVIKQSDWNDRTGGTLRCTLNSNFSLGVGSYDKIVAVQSGNSSDAYYVRLEVPYTAILTEAGGENPDPGQPENPNDDVDPVTEPTLSTEWKYTTGIPGAADGGHMRFGAALNGKLLVNDKENGKILYWDETHQGADYKTGLTLGTAINVDEAGNIIVNNAFSGVNSSTDFTIIPADGSANVPLTVSLSNTAARFDQLGRIVGDVMSADGGYMFVDPAGATSVDIIKIANGVQVSDYSVASAPTGWTGSTSTVVHPIPGITVSKIDEMYDNDGDHSMSFVARQRGTSGSVFVWGQSTDGGMQKVNLSMGSVTEVTTASATNEGFETFSILDKVYYVVPLTTDGSSNTRGTVFGIFDKDGNIVTHIPASENIIGGTMQSFSVEKKNKNSVYIYQWLPGKIAAKYKFSVPAQSSSVENLEVVGDDSVRYFNLQGLEVSNPEGGIFIRVQGNKATKVLVK